MPRFKDHHDLAVELGLQPSAHLPPEGLTTRIVNVADNRRGGEPLLLPVYVTRPSGSYSKHRTYAICTCGKHVSVGRLVQHWPMHKNQEVGG